MNIVYVCSHRAGNRLSLNHFFNSGLLALFKDDNSLQMLSVCGLMNPWITYGLWIIIIIIMGSRCNIYSIIEPSHQSGATVILLEPWLKSCHFSERPSRTERVEMSPRSHWKCLHTWQNGQTWSLWVFHQFESSRSHNHTRHERKNIIPLAFG